MATTRSRKSSAKSAAKRGAKRAAASSSAAKPKMPNVIFAQASPKSIGGVSMFEAQGQINADTIENFLSDESRNAPAVEALQRAGFEVLQVSDFTINIAAPRSVYEEAFKTKLFIESKPVIKGQGKEDMAEFIDSRETDLPGLITTEGTQFADLLEGVAIEEPRYFMAPVATFNPPLKAYWHLHPPGDLSAALNADRAHRAGLTGRGVKVAMVDSGWFRHPYFTVRGYNAANAILGPGATSPLTDESGHGTGESANIFAVAPDAQLLPVKMSFTNTIGAFNAAVGLGPHIITCSWGGDKQNGPLTAADMVLAAAVAAAVRAGIIVVFSAGNGQFGFPGQHPDVISAGGTFMNSDETLQASNYASGFMSSIYPNRSVPDLCGLVGMRPKAIYIMLPLQPGDDIDVRNSGGTHPNGDQTLNNDGWAAFSGTSAAAPQLAGAAALVKQACPRLTPQEVREVLMKSARDVTTGVCFQGFSAAAGFDQATGAGLVDVHKAAMIAKLKCVPIGPLPPSSPGLASGIHIAHPEPMQAAPGAEFGFTASAAEALPRPQPIIPIAPIRPRPVVPITPVRPSPIQAGPVHPIVPVRPVRPIVPIRPIRPEPMTTIGLTPASFDQQGGGALPEQEAGGGSMSAEEVRSLEELITSGDLEIE
jgi:subtilisin family serine protease